MKARDLEGFGPVGTNGPASGPIPENGHNIVVLAAWSALKREGKTGAAADLLDYITSREALLAEATKGLREAVDHLDWCDYGDSWERECARDAKLPDRLSALLTRLEAK